MGYEIEPLEIFSAKQLNDAYYEILAQLTGEMSIKQVVDYMAKLMNSGVLLYTYPENRIFIACDDSRAYTSLLMLQFQLSVSTNSDLRSFFQQERTAHNATRFPGIYLDHFARINCNALSGDLTGTKGAMGTLCLLDVDLGILDEQSETLQLFLRILSRKLTQEAPLYEIDQEEGSKEHIDINNGTQWLRKLKGDSFQNFYIAVIDAFTEEQVQQVKSELENGNLLFRMVTHESYIIVLLNVRDNDEAASMRGTLDKMAGTYGLSIGLSYRFQGTENIHESFLEATDALNTARFMGQSNHLLPYEQFAVDALLLGLVSTASLDCYRNERLDDLCRSDAQNGTQYYETLHCFLSCGASKQKASQQLYIHRNTLSYRLERIEDFLKEDLSDINTQTKLYLDIKIREMLDRSNMQDKA